MTGVEYPWNCGECGRQNMVNLPGLERRAVDKLVSVDGFVCAACGMWVNVFYSTLFLRQALLKLDGMDVKRKDFRFHFGKALKQAENLKEKMEKAL